MKSFFKFYFGCITLLIGLFLIIFDNMPSYGIGIAIGGIIVLYTI
jgi:hypothetical protein